MLKSLTLFFCFIFLPALHGIAEPVVRGDRTLASVAKAVFERSENLKISQELISKSLSQYDEAIAAVYPSVSAGASQIFRNDATGSRNENSDVGGGTSSREPSQFETFLSVSQPLFTGFRELLAVEAIEKEGDAQRLLQAREQELLFLSAAELYYQIVLYKKDLRILADTQSVLEDRIKELQDWVTLGKSRESEVLQAQSEHAEVVSIIERTKGLLSSTSVLLSSLSGIPTAELQLDEDLAPKILEAMDVYLARAEQRPDIVALLRLQDAAHARIKIAERERWPTLRLEGNAYPHTDPDLDKEWDVALKMEVPLFDAGAISARVAQAKSDAVIKRLEEEKAKREARRDVESLYTSLDAAKREFAQLQKQRQIVERSFTSLQNDYKNGVVSNLDVLRALTQVQEVKRRTIGAQAQIKLTEARLEVAAGGIVVQ